MVIEHAVRKLTPRELFLLTTPDDTEDALWMVTPEYQWNIVNLLMSVLRLHIARQELPWYIAAELLVVAPIRPGNRRSLSVAPDLLVAEADSRERVSWKIAEEGAAPAFVLEVVTAESLDRDLDEKPEIYEAMGVREYVVFAPRRTDGGAILSGYARQADGAFAPWPMASSDTLRSAVLGLDLVVVDGRWLRPRGADGLLLPSAEEEAAVARRERTRAEAATQEARTQALRAEAAEAELVRLRALLADRDA